MRREEGVVQKKYGEGKGGHGGEKGVITWKAGKRIPMKGEGGKEKRNKGWDRRVLRKNQKEGGGGEKTTGGK